MIRTVSETGSTSADIAARLRAGELVPEGHWLVADRQTQGRGRQGRTWFDGAGNFMGSTVVHLRAADPEPATLALVAGLAVHSVIAPLLPRSACAFLKWPNDLLIGDAKLAGILLERVGEAVVVGIGVNLAGAPRLDDRPAAALSAFGAAPARDAFAAALASGFATEIERWRSFGVSPVVARWQEAAHPLGTRLSVVDQGQPLIGAFVGLSDTGALQLRLADGTSRVIHAGEVHLASPEE